MYTIKSKNRVTFCSDSLLGARKRQEDYHICRRTADRIIAVVCDGMGGMNAGNIASRLAAEMLFEDLKKVSLSCDMQSFFKNELAKLDDMVYGLKNADGTRMRAGTTVVAVMLCGYYLYWFSVGDSKLFYMRKGKLYCVTRMHNCAMLGKNAGGGNGVDEQLISYLGMGAAEIFDGSRKPFVMEQGDKLLLCTDGLYRTVRQYEIEEILSGTQDVEKICGMLRNAVTGRNLPKQDNATWIVIGS